MSRFDKALQRARTSSQSANPPGIAMPEEAPAADLFDAPWDFGEPEPAASPAPPSDGRQTRISAPPRVHQQPATQVVEAGSPESAPTAQMVEPRPSPDVLTEPTRAPLLFNADVAEKVIAFPKADHVVVEQYRKLAASLHQWQLEHGGKVVMVASAVASEGKTLTALNLALTLSTSYQRRVLLLDCDLRRPRMHEVLQISAQPGMSDVTAATAATPRAMSDRLFVVPAGRSTDDPVGTLTSAAMTALIDAARHEYDWVIIDTPPAAVLPDASLLSDLVDGAVLVVAAGRTEFEMVSRAVGAIGRERLLGVVLNGIDSRDMSIGRYQNYYYAKR